MIHFGFPFPDEGAHSVVYSVAEIILWDRFRQKEANAYIIKFPLHAKEMNRLSRNE